jgi:hypothetical protein
MAATSPEHLPGIESLTGPQPISPGETGPGPPGDSFWDAKAIGARPRANPPGDAATDVTPELNFWPSPDGSEHKLGW